VGLDVGRDFVRAAIANLAGEIVARRDERARVRSQRTLISQIGDVSHALAAEAGVKWKQVTLPRSGAPGSSIRSPDTWHWRTRSRVGGGAVCAGRPG
jgi:predicted NBD/HSP70 family sugar kinase